MINNVRNTVLAIINKENKGYISPEEFNLFCTMAQLEIFEDYFYEYTKWIRKQNQRLTNSEYSDLPKNLREKIDIFSTRVTPTLVTGITGENAFSLPDTVYRVETVVYNSNTVVDEIQKKDILLLNQANLSDPTTTFPVYVRLNDQIIVYPQTIDSNITCYCLRKPLTPKWTYSVVSGNPVYNPSALDYQDLEIHPSDETKLILKVLSYSGISIREMDVAQISEALNDKDYQKENS